jgi:hypothetical protein
MEFLTAQYEQSRGIDSSLTRRLKSAMQNTSGPAASATPRPTSLYSFIRSGQIAAGTTERDMRVMLDLARDLILSYGEQAKAAATAPGTLNAKQALALVEKPKMTKAEWDKVPHAQRGNLIKKIMLVD